MSTRTITIDDAAGTVTYLDPDTEVTVTAVNGTVTAVAFRSGEGVPFAELLAPEAQRTVRAALAVLDVAGIDTAPPGDDHPDEPEEAVAEFVPTPTERRAARAKAARQTRPVVVAAANGHRGASKRPSDAALRAWVRENGRDAAGLARAFGAKSSTTGRNWLKSLGV